MSPRVPISAKLVADLITAAGASRVLHHRSARRPDPGLLRHPRRQPVRDAGAAEARCRSACATVRSAVVVARSGRRRARARLREAARCDAGDHRQARGRVPTRSPRCASSAMSKARPAVIVDDIVDTAGTLATAAAALREAGAHGSDRVLHASRARPARRSSASAIRQLTSLVVTDTIPLRPEGRTAARSRCCPWRTLLAEAILPDPPRGVDQLAVRLRRAAVSRR